MKITKRACDDLAKRPAANRRETHWDEEVPGFGARVNGPGRVAFVMKYRVKGDPTQRFLTLGEWPAVLPDNARAEAKTVKAAAALGRDLVAERRAEAAEVTRSREEAHRRAIPLPTVLDIWRAALEGSATTKEAEGRSARYERELLRMEARVLRPALRHETVGGLDPELFQAIVAAQATPSNQRNVRAALVHFIRHAKTHLLLQGVKVTWPTSFEVTGKVRSRRSRYSIEDAARTYVAAGTLGRRGAAIRWMMLTACRRTEAAKVSRRALALDDVVVGPNWFQSDKLTKNGEAHRVPLSPPAVALARWLPPRELSHGRGTADLLFAGRGGKPIGDWTTIRRALSETSGVDGGTLHDFRRTIVSALGDHGFDVEVADQLLNHSAANTMSGVMRVYQASELWEKRRAAMDLWTRLLMTAVERLTGREGEAAWGFADPFEDVRIVRPERRGPENHARRKAGRRPKPPSPPSDRARPASSPP